MYYGASRTLPTPGAKDTCPICDSAVIAKCGEVVAWHWAHASTRDCDPWSEGVTDWHLYWQGAVEPDRQEIVLGRHRADMALDSGLICEVQHSAIDARQIRERESFYDRMIWILDARDPYRKGNFEIGRSWRFNGGDYASIWWKYKKKASWEFRKRVYIDTGEGIYLFESFPDGSFYTDRFKFRARRLDRMKFFASLSREHKKKKCRFVAYYDTTSERVAWRREQPLFLTTNQQPATPDIPGKE